MPAGHAAVLRELVVPILRNERIVAVLGVGNKPQEYDQIDVEMVQSLANLAWDIVMRKKAEEQTDLQARVLDQTSDRVCITDLDGVIRYVNEAECLALKRSRSELIGRHISIFGEDAELGATRQEVIDSTLANGRWRGEVVNFASNGVQSMVDLRTFLVRSPSDKAVALCGIGTDITELKKSESELRHSQGKLRDLYHQLQHSREEERRRISPEDPRRAGAEHHGPADRHRVAEEEDRSRPDPIFCKAGVDGPLSLMPRLKPSGESPRSCARAFWTPSGWPPPSTGWSRISRCAAKLNAGLSSNPKKSRSRRTWQPMCSEFCRRRSRTSCGMPVRQRWR